MGIADSLQLPSSKQGAIIDSGALLHFCPDKPKFINFKPLKGKIICTANDSVLYIHGIEKVAIELPNSSGKMKCILKETIYSPEMAFTLISAFCLDKAGCLTIFAKSQYTIKNPNGKVMPTLTLLSDLYCLMMKGVVTSPKVVNVASVKISLHEAHLRCRHIAHAAIKYAVEKGLICQNLYLVSVVWEVPRFPRGIVIGARYVKLSSYVRVLVV